MFWPQRNAPAMWRSQLAVAIHHAGLRGDPLSLIREASRDGLISSWRELAPLAGGAAPGILDPAVVAQFALAFTANEPARSVLDPWAGLGLTIAALDDAGHLSLRCGD